MSDELEFTPVPVQPELPEEPAQPEFAEPQVLSEPEMPAEDATPSEPEIMGRQARNAQLHEKQITHS